MNSQARSWAGAKRARPNHHPKQKRPKIPPPSLSLGPSFVTGPLAGTTWDPSEGAGQAFGGGRSSPCNQHPPCWP